MELNINDVYNISDDAMVDELINYIGKDYILVPYLYLDIWKYRCGNENVKTWYLLKNERIECIFLLYYNCLHIYSKNSHQFVFDKIAEVIDNIQPHTIITIDKIGEYLQKSILDKYMVVQNYIMSEEKVDTSNIRHRCELALEDDLPDIADLFLKSEHYKKLYNKEVLLAQFKQRYRDSFSRFYIIRDGKKVIASCSTYGENDKIAMVSGLITDPEYLRQGLGASVFKYVCKVLQDEGKLGIGFNSPKNVASYELALKTGSYKIGLEYEFVKKAL